MWIAIIAWFLLFMFLVIVHELWHFIAAKKSWVKVLEFGIWIPPKAFKIYTDKSWTEYTINWLPLGGFVRLKWENPEDEETFHAKDSFITQNIWKKLFILVWWVAVNLFFAWLFFAAAFWKGIQPISIVPEWMMSIETNSLLMPSRNYLDSQWYLSWEIQAEPVKILDMVPDGIAAKEWLLTWDIITHINEKEVDTMNLWSTLRNKIWQDFTLHYQRDWEEKSIDTQCRSDRCLLGILMDQWWEIEVLTIQKWFVDWSLAAGNEIVAQTRLTFHVLWIIWWKLLTFDSQEAKEAVENLAWPVWAVKVWEIILDEFGIWQYIAFGGMISLALAIFNILPLPALDGGRAVGVIIQSVWRFKPEKYFVIENYFNFLFFMLLMALGIYIIFLDLARFWWVNPFGMWF